jgi:hypothetical protein
MLVEPRETWRIFSQLRYGQTPNLTPNAVVWLPDAALHLQQRVKRRSVQTSNNVLLSDYVCDLHVSLLCRSREYDVADIVEAKISSTSNGWCPLHPQPARSRTKCTVIRMPLTRSLPTSATSTGKFSKRTRIFAKALNVTWMPMCSLRASCIPIRKGYEYRSRLIRIG